MVPCPCTSVLSMLLDILNAMLGPMGRWHTTMPFVSFDFSLSTIRCVNSRLAAHSQICFSLYLPAHTSGNATTTITRHNSAR